MRTLFLCLLFVIAILPVKAQNWGLVWFDEFNVDGLPDPTKWGNEVGYLRNDELQYYTKGRIENSSIENGNLLIIGKKENYNGFKYTSASLTTDGKHSWTYGKVEARMKLPKGQGMWPAFWMLGQNIHQVSWPKSGEIDIMEHINSEDKLYGTAHWDNKGYTMSGGSVPCTVAEFHVYSIEWTSKSIKWFLDSKKYWEVIINNNFNSSEEFHKPFYIILNLAIGGKWPGNPTSSTLFPDTVFVDYVRVYQDSTLTSINSFQTNNIKLYPTTANSDLIVELPEEDINFELDIFDSKGQLLIHRKLTETKETIAVNELDRGSYIARVSNGKTVYHQQFIKL